MNIVPLILSGGSGARLWPLSRVGRPKQFLDLNGAGSLFQRTLQRVIGIPGVRAPLVVCNQDHRFVVAEQAETLGIQLGCILLEPVGRNTAPAIALGALHQLNLAGDALLLILPCDHEIPNVSNFHRAVDAAVQQAFDGSVILFGVTPTGPETGFGYVKAAGDVEGVPLQVERFIEKPDQSTANSFLLEGGCFWNSGMFMIRASVYLEELSKYSNDILVACQASYSGLVGDLDFCRVDPVPFAACRSESIDYAVLEKTDKTVIIPLDADWNDVGSWSAVYDIAEKDGARNVSHGDVVLNACEGNYVYASSRLVVCEGVDGLVVIETPDAVLVMRKERSQDVKVVVDRLKQNRRSEVELHREVFRPWGSYDCIGRGKRYQVKRICVKPGEKLSLQMHHHRAEHWIVVSGTASVQIGEGKQLVGENQSVYIPLGVIHSLENPGKIPLELIEIQSGAYLGEDDIVRLEDIYGRAAVI